MTYSSPYLAFYRKRRSKGGGESYSQPLRPRGAPAAHTTDILEKIPPWSACWAWWGGILFFPYVRIHIGVGDAVIWHETLLSLSSSSSSSSSSFLFTQFRVRPFRECPPPSAAMEAERPLRYQRVRVYSNFCNRVRVVIAKMHLGKNPKRCREKSYTSARFFFCIWKIILFI
jgi:hypothetical protein